MFVFEHVIFLSFLGFFSGTLCNKSSCVHILSGTFNLDAVVLVCSQWEAD